MKALPQLSAKDRKNFRAIGHKLKPIVTVASKGLSASVCEEIERALNDHELIKIKFAVGDRDIKKQLVDELCTQLSASQVQIIGHIALLYRPVDKPDPRLSNLLR